MDIKNIKCGKCGTINENIEGKCKECGEFLYQFYLKERRKKMLISSLVVVGVVMFVGMQIFYTEQRHKKEEISPLKKALTEYMIQLNKANDYIYNDRLNKEYKRIVLGIIDVDVVMSVVKEMGLSEVPKAGTSQEKQLQKKLGILRGKHTVLEKVRAEKIYCNFVRNTYSKITPSDYTVNNLHESLIEAYKSCEEAQQNFDEGVSLGYITNVRDKDGVYTWNYSRDGRGESYSSNYKAFTKKYTDLEENFPRKLAQIAEANGLMKEYAEVYPFEAWEKNKITK